MSSPQGSVPTIVTAEEVLAFDQDQLVKLLNDCRTPRNEFDISRVHGVDDLSNGQRIEFSEKVSAAAKKAGPLNFDLLSDLLSGLAGNDSTGDRLLLSQNPQLRSPTCSPVPTRNIDYEAFSRDELVKAGGRPAASFELLLDTMKDAKAGRQLFEPWRDDTDASSREGNVPPVFSTQLEDWKTFRQSWQWDNRGNPASEEGFDAYLESERRRLQAKGETGVVNGPDFESTERRIWKDQSRHLELSGSEGFGAYAQAVKKRLASHAFTEPFQLAEDPRHQDPWTTWVEYLSYTWALRDSYTAKRHTAESRYWKAWDELLRFDNSPRSDSLSTFGTIDEQLGAARAEVETTRQQLRKFIDDTDRYRRWDTAVYRQDLRAQWIRKQLPLLEISYAEDRANMNNSSSKSGKKRKVIDDHKSMSWDRPNRRRQEAGHREPKQDSYAMLSPNNHSEEHGNLDEFDCG